MDDVLDKLQNIFNPDDVVVAGISGGVDSMTLLYLLSKLNIKIICAHVNHNVRKISYKEKIFVNDYCDKLNIVFETMTIEKYGDDNFHNEARNIRYHYFDGLVNKYHAKYLITAHHGDDLIETILMRISRGSTLGGYSGFKEIIDKDNYKILRPLINKSKQEIKDYASLNKIPYMEDASNKKDKYTRNRYRKYIVPKLKEENSNLVNSFLKFSKELENADNFINQEMSKYIKIVINNNKLDITKYLELDSFAKKRILGYVLKSNYADDLILINDKHLELINDLIISKKVNTYIYLPNNIKVIKNYNELIFDKGEDDIFTYEIEISDIVCLPNNKTIEKCINSDEKSNNIIRLNSKDINLPLIVRTRKDGDKIELKGLNGRKKIKDIFIDNKIAMKERDLWPIVEDSSGRIVWIPGIKKSNLDVEKNNKCDIILRYY